MTQMPDTLVILPILLPLAAGAVMLFLDDRLRGPKAIINVVSTLVLLCLGIFLTMQASAQGDGALIATYPVGNWPVPFGIVLVADRLSALMVLLTSILGLCALLYSLARWHAAGPNFHSLFQFLLMGLNGAFLTGDLFNLFVFFEVLLAASYGLALHGLGVARVKAGLHYVAMNLVASSLFLIGAALIYGVTGTLNMADLAAKVPQIVGTDRGLFETGAAVLGIAFLLKAGMWPLGLWLPYTYAAASPPVAALFAIMTKVGVYAVLRLSVLVLGDGADASAGFGQSFVLIGGMATIAFGAIGVLASQSPARMASYFVLVSSGTVLAAIGIGNSDVTAGAMYYLIVSTLAVSAFFLMVELLNRVRSDGGHVLAVTLEAYGDDEGDAEDEEVGLAIPGAMAVLSVSYGLCVILLASLPPLSGFLAKVSIISALLNPLGMTETTPIPVSSWWLTGLLIVSGFAALIALTRTGINTFWVSISENATSVRVIEILPVLLLLAAAIGLTVMAGPVTGYMHALADALYSPAAYISDVMQAPLAGAIEGGAQ